MTFLPLGRDSDRAESITGAADKNDLVEHAQGKDAPDEVLMKEFPEQEYGSAAEVAQAIGQVKHWHRRDRGRRAAGPSFSGVCPFFLLIHTQYSKDDRSGRQYTGLGRRWWPSESDCSGSAPPAIVHGRSFRASCRASQPDGDIFMTGRGVDVSRSEHAPRVERRHWID